MPYTYFDKTAPDPAVQNGTEAFDSTRKNELATRDIGVLHAAAGWDAAIVYNVGTDLPSSITYTSADTPAELLRASLTWSLPLGETSILQTVNYEYQVSGDPGWTVIGYVTYSYSGDLLTSTSWTLP